MSIEHAWLLALTWPLFANRHMSLQANIMLMIVKRCLNNEDITANCLIQLSHVTLHEITQSKQLLPKDKIFQLGHKEEVNYLQKKLISNITITLMWSKSYCIILLISGYFTGNHLKNRTSSWNAILSVFVTFTKMLPARLFGAILR